MKKDKSNLDSSMTRLVVQAGDSIFSLCPFFYQYGICYFLVSHILQTHDGRGGSVLRRDVVPTRGMIDVLPFCLTTCSTTPCTEFKCSWEVVVELTRWRRVGVPCCITNNT